MLKVKLIVCSRSKINPQLKQKQKNFEALEYSWPKVLFATHLNSLT